MTTPKTQRFSPMVLGEEAHLTARHLLDVLGKAIIAAARGQWDLALAYSNDASMLSERLSQTRNTPEIK